MQIFTDYGRVYVPDDATNYESLLELLTRISSHTAELGSMRKPWLERLVFGIAAVLILSAILWSIYLLV